MSCRWNHFRAVVLILAGVFAVAQTSLVLAESKLDETLVILSKLPANTSAAYTALRNSAGATQTNALEMTGSELWHVPQKNMQALRHAAGRHNVALKVQNETWSQALMPKHGNGDMSGRQKAMMKKTMASKAVMGLSMMALPDPSVFEYALTKDDDTAQSDAPATLVIPLKDGMTATARRTSITKRPDGYVWRGLIDGTDEPVTLLWRPTGHLAGTVTHAGHTFVVKDFGDGMHGVVEYAPEMLPPDHGGAGDKMMRKMNMKEDPLVHQGEASMLAPGPRSLRDVIDMGSPAGDPTEMVTIALVVAYTEAAAGHYESIEQDLIDLAVAQANQSFRDSGINNVRIDVVHAYQTDYTERGSHFDHVYGFRNRDDGVMDEIHELRDRYGGDIAILVVDDGMGCGLSIRIAAEEKDAFGVVHHECASTMHSLAHEIGHLIGARHDRAIDKTSSPFPYGHGYVHGTQWRTMMSYKDSCDGCERRPVWSGPDVTLNGISAGDARTNNARVIRDQAGRVAAFRNSPSYETSDR